MSRTRPILAAAALVLTLSAAGHAAPAGAPVATLGKGYAPSVAVEKDGTAHVTWFQDGGGVDTLRYCRIAPRAATCEAQHAFAGTGDASYRNWRPVVFVRGQEVTLIGSFRRPQAAPVVYDHLLVTSDDGGTTWGTPVPVGNPQGGAPVDAVTDGTGSFGLVSEGALFTVAGEGTGPVTDRSFDLTSLVSRPEAVGTPTIALDGDKSPVVAADHLGDTRVWRVSSGGLSRAFVATKWTVGQAIADEILPVVSGGSGQVYAMTIRSPGGRCPCRYVFRRWGGTAFEAPFDTIQDFTGTGGSTGQDHDLFTDAQGRVHAVWSRSRPPGGFGAPVEIRYARSPGGGKDFGPPVTLALRGARTNPIDLQVAAAGGGRGVVVWEEGGSAADGSGGTVRAVATQAPGP